MIWLMILWTIVGGICFCILLGHDVKGVSQIRAWMVVGLCGPMAWLVAMSAGLFVVCKKILGGE